MMMEGDEEHRRSIVLAPGFHAPALPRSSLSFASSTTPTAMTMSNVQTRTPPVIPRSDAHPNKSKLEKTRQFLLLTIDVERSCASIIRRPSMSNNPTQWPSCTNLSVWYAEHSGKRLKHLQAVVVFLQRSWLRRKDDSIQLHPIVLENRAYNIWDSREALKNDAVLDQKVFAYEKLDGTNVGIRCDGAIFGRRQRIVTDSYQKCQLEGVVPTRDQVELIKLRIAQLVSVELPRMLLYGELMVNNKFNYNERNLVKKWVCFGAMFAAEENIGNNGYLLEKASMLADRLREIGFYATASPDSGKIKLVMNPRLARLLQKSKLAVAPFAGSGLLKDLCLSQKSLMMENNIEGLVLTGQGFLQKWKTGYEDESKGHDELCRVVKSSKTTLELAGIDIEFAELLKQISGNGSKPSRDEVKAAKEKRRGKEHANDGLYLYSEKILNAAMESALTKYDALDIYFARNERSVIADCLRKELLDDLNATTKAETQAVGKFVNRRIGLAFGKFKREYQ